MQLHCGDDEPYNIGVSRRPNWKLKLHAYISKMSNGSNEYDVDDSVMKFTVELSNSSLCS